MDVSQEPQVHVLRSSSDKESRNMGWYSMVRNVILSITFSMGSDNNEQLSTCLQTLCHLTAVG